MRKWLAAIVSAAMLLGTAACAAAAQPAAAGELKVHVLDIGQGDSIFIELPDQSSMLIDAGNPGDGKTILRYIEGLGYSSIDYVVATHPHADHIGAMDEVINGIGVKEVYAPNATSDTRNYLDFLQAVKNKGLKIKLAKSGVEIPAGDGVKMAFAGPVGTGYDDLNNYSAILKITYGTKSFLFTGDAEAMAEGEITANIKADVLKVGHHGSDTSTSDAFLTRVSPKYAAISVGKGNTYGHPVQSTLDKLKAAGAAVYRTDVDGTVVFATDGNTLSVSTSATPEKAGAPSTAQKRDASPPDTSASSSSSSVSKVDSASYVLNTNTKKFHKESCSQVKKIKAENYATVSSRGEAEAQGYAACKICNP